MPKKKQINPKIKLNDLYFEMERIIDTTSDLKEMTGLCLGHISSAIGAHIYSMRTWDRQRSELKLFSAFYADRDKMLGIMNFSSSGEGIDSSTISQGSVQIIEDIKKDKLFKYSQFAKKEEITSIISIPMMSYGRINGVVTFFFRKKPGFTIDSINPIFMMISTIARIFENQKLREDNEILAGQNKIDDETGFYNYDFFMEALKREYVEGARFKYPLCLAMISIDGSGREESSSTVDQQMKCISEVIRKHVHPYDMAFRYDENHFVVIFPHSKNNKVFPVVEKIRKEISRNEGMIVSIGLANIPDNARTMEGLIDRANQALHLSEKEGGDRITSSLVFSRNSIRLGFCPPILHPFYNNILKGVKSVLNDFQDVELIVRAPDKESAEAQEKATEGLINEKVNAIAICSKTESIINKQMKKAKAAGIPVFLFNIVKVPLGMEAGDVVSKIGYDQVEAGRLVGKYLVRLLRGKGNIAILEGLPDALDSTERKSGFLEGIKEFPKLKLVVSERADWDRKKAKEVTANILKKYSGLDAVFGVSDEMALGAQDAIEEAGRAGELFTVGLDGNANAFKSIKEGRLTATLNTNPIEMGKILMITIIKSMIKEEKIEPDILSPLNMVDIQNLDLYLP